MLPQLENSAGQRFRTIPHLAWLAEGDDMPVERHRLYIAQGTEWVALSDVGSLVGFLAAEVFEAELHIWQLAVRLDDQGRGVGGRLLEAADSFARARNLRSITLTTFADVPWNAPWYSRHGFTVATDDERLAGLTRMESSRGLPGRCAMRKRIGDRVLRTQREIDGPLQQGTLRYPAG